MQIQARTILAFAAGFLLTFFSAVLTVDSAPDHEPPLDVLYVSGGGYHDYETQKKIIPEGLRKRVNVNIEVSHVSGGKSARKKHKAFKQKNWSEEYDLVMYNICNSANMNNPEWVKRIVRPHKEGLPAVFIHCAMHCFRPDKSREWQKLIGVTTTNHEGKHPITMTNLKPNHPIMTGFPDEWTTPKGELYRIKNVWENTVPLAKGVAGEKKEHTCTWINKYGKGRVFGTTIGHHNETVRKDTYLDMLGRGMLWAAGKLQDNGKPAPGYGVK